MPGSTHENESVTPDSYFSCSDLPVGCLPFEKAAFLSKPSSDYRCLKSEVAAFLVSQLPQCVFFNMSLHFEVERGQRF